MLTKRRQNPQEVISIEEYLSKRQQIREQEERGKHNPQSVIEKGSTNGTITDMDGNFILNVGSKDAIIFFGKTMKEHCGI